MRYALYDVYKATIGRYLYEIDTLPSEWRYYSRRQKIIFIVSVIVLFMLVGCIDYQDSKCMIQRFTPCTTLITTNQ